MFSSLYFQMFLWIFWISILHISQTRASATITEIYADSGMSKVHIPCFAVETELSKQEAPPKIESMWIREDEKIIVKDENGIRETFRGLTLSGPIQSHANLTNVQYYGRVNFSASYGLIINSVKADDGGTYLCRYKTTDTLASGKSEVKLVVFNASALITEIYGYNGMPVHLPCFAIEKLGLHEAPQIKSMWARKEGGSYEQIIFKDENGTRETFRRLTLSGPIQSHENLTNVRYYGRVNFSASYGLIINKVKADDGGLYLCRYKTTDTMASGSSKVKLVVFEPSTIINDMFNTSLVNDTAEPEIINNATDSGNGVSNSDNHNEDSSCIFWKVVVGVLAVSFPSFVLGGVLKYWPYIKRVWRLTHAAGGNDRTDDSDQPEENHVLNEFTDESVDGQSIPDGSPCIAQAIIRPSKGMGNCVPNETASAQSIPQVSSGSPRIRNGYVVENTEDRSIPQVCNAHPSDDAAGTANAQGIPEGRIIAYPNKDIRYHY